MACAPSGTTFARLMSVLNRQLERAEAQDFPMLITHGRFSSMPVLEVTSSGISRSRRQWAGL
jgi:hypothetical protein